MLVSDLITTMRDENDDSPVLTGEKFDGDGTIKAFRLKYAPVIENSYTVKIGVAVQVETTHYTINRNTGLITFVTAPIAGSDNVTVDYEYAKLDNASYLNIINGVIAELKSKLWNDELDSTTLTTVANQSEYDLSSISNRIFRVIDVWYRPNSNTDWTSISTSTNISYWREQNKLNVRPYMSVTGYAMKIRYLEYFDQYTLTSQTVLIDDEYLEPIKYFGRVRFIDRLMSKMAVHLGASVTEPTYEPMNNLINLRKTFLNQAEASLTRVKPRIPSTRINTIKFGKKS